MVSSWAVGWVLLWRVPKLRAASARTRPTLSPAGCTVVIPCRNEEGNIGGLLRALREQDVAPRRIIVVDDDSSDRTREVAAAAGAEVLALRDLPEGWVGKNWACHNGAQQVHDGIIVFLDADVRPAPEFMDELRRAVGSRGGLVSVAPWHTVHRPYEWGSMLFGIMSYMGVGFASVISTNPSAAFGPCIAMTAEDYHALGGHESVRNVAVEDIELAKRARSCGIGISVLGGGRSITYRMYPSGFAQLLQGWSKNIASGAARASGPRAIFSAMWFVGLLSALVDAVLGGWWGLIAVVPWAAQLLRMARLTGSFPAMSVLAAPLLACLFVAVFIWSIVQAVFLHRVTWRGRRVPVVFRAPAAGHLPGRRVSAEPPAAA